MARINRSGFKMKRTPVKGKLDNFFSSLGKQLKRNKKSIKEETIVLYIKTWMSYLSLKPYLLI